MFDWFFDFCYNLEYLLLDFFRSFLWAFTYVFLWVIDDIYDSIYYIPNLMSDLLNLPQINTAYQKMFILASTLLILLIIIQGVRMILGNSNLDGLPKKLLIVGAAGILLPSIFTFGVDMTIALQGEVNGLFGASKDGTELTYIIANTFTMKNEGLDPKQDSIYSDNPYDDEHGLYSDVINYRYTVTTTDEDGDEKKHEQYIYSFIPWLASPFISLGIVALLGLSAIKLFYYIIEVLFYKLVAPLFMILGIGSNDILEQSFKNYFNQLWKSFLSITLQFLAIEFSLLVMESALSLNTSDNIFVTIVLIIGSLFIMLDGTNAIVNLFQTDTGISTVAQGVGMGMLLKGGADVISSSIGGSTNAILGKQDMSGSRSGGLVGMGSAGMSNLANLTGANDFFSGAKQGFGESKMGTKATTTADDIKNAVNNNKDNMSVAGMNIGNSVGGGSFSGNKLSNNENSPSINQNEATSNIGKQSSSVNPMQGSNEPLKNANDDFIKTNEKNLDNNISNASTFDRDLGNNSTPISNGEDLVNNGSHNLESGNGKFNFSYTNGKKQDSITMKPKQGGKND